MVIFQEIKLKKAVQFYSYWSNYLEPTNAVMSLASLGGALAKANYYILSSLEHVFNNMFKLFWAFWLSWESIYSYW